MAEEEILQNKKLTCKDCGNEFIWTVSEQKFFNANNLVPPKRCKACRVRKRNQVAQDEREGKYRKNG